MSTAPALRAAVHISSSARRCVQTMQIPRNSCDKRFTSDSGVFSISTITTSARFLAMLRRNSSTERTARTEWKELHNEATRDSEIRGSLWRRTTLENCMATSRSEEHTSELQSRFDLVCRLLLE